MVSALTIASLASMEDEPSAGAFFPRNSKALLTCGSGALAPEEEAPKAFAKDPAKLAAGSATGTDDELCL